MMENFFLVLAWAGFVIGIIMFSLSLWLEIDYQGSIEEALDSIKGRRKVFPTKQTFFITLISGCYLVSVYFM